MEIQGSCACGKTSYEISDDAGIDIANCHCRQCRQSSGGTCVTWATVLKDRFRWTGSTPGEYQSSEHTTRYFCKTCGAQLALYTTRSPNSIDVTVTTFSNPENYPPARDIWLKSKIHWIPLDPKLPGENEETL